jgi:hypothetical protein
MGSAGFWGYLCARSRWITLGHVLVWIGVVLNTISLVAVETTPGTDVVIVMNYVGMFAAIVVSGFVLIKCNNSDG